MNLIEFKKELMELLPSGHSRPFVCNGSPLDCEVFIIGINPATELNDFWEDWNDETGFDFNEWFDNYKINRKEKGKRAISPTRRNLNIISEALSKENIKVLETNLYAKEVARAKEVIENDKNTDVLNFLIHYIQPKILLVHGNDVINIIEKKFEKKLHKDEFSEGNIQGIAIHILPIQHLSYQFSKEKAEGVAQRLIKKYKDL